MRVLDRQTQRIFTVVMVMASMLGFSTLVQAEELWKGWTGSIFAGYNETSGNTDKGSASVAAEAVKKFDGAEFSLKGNIFYSQSNENMDGQKWDILAKYYFDFGDEGRWFNFYQVLADHDYFADIDYRITPATGIGYHIARTEEWTWDADAGLGYRITRHRINTAADDEAVTAIAHTVMKRKVFDNAFLSEDLTVYPGLESGSGVILRSETAFTNPLSENLDFEIKYIYDYNSEPAAGKKSADKQIIAGIKYKF
jgi:putative salt-induced outer membrane protein